MVKYKDWTKQTANVQRKVLKGRQKAWRNIVHFNITRTSDSLEAK